mgnify:CR=1 FL=1
MARLTEARRPEPAPLPVRPSLINGRTLWLLLLVLAIVWSLAQANVFGRDLVNSGGSTLLLRFLQASVRPDLSQEFLLITFNAALVTLGYAVCGVALSTLLGLIGGVFMSEVWWKALRASGQGRGDHYAPWLTVRAILAIPRAIHEIIWGLFFVNILGLTPLTAILAIAIPFGAITAKVFSEILDETSQRPLEALLHSGASPSKAMLYGLFPTAFPNLLSYTFYRLECSIRSSTMLGLIGAGGLGFELLLSLQSLRYEQMWTLLYALFLLNGATDYWSGLLRRRLGSTGQVELHGAHPTQQVQTPRPQDAVVRGSLLFALALLLFSFWYVRPNPGQLLAPQTMERLAVVAANSFPPDFGSQAPDLLRLTLQTLAISILAMTFASITGVVFSFLAARNFLAPGGILLPGNAARGWRLWGGGVLILARTTLLIARSIPPPIWALVLLFVLFPGLIPGALALGIYTMGILGRLMAEAVENLDERPLRALRAQGATGSHVFLYAALPGTLPDFIAYTLYRWEVTIRETVVVGIVGAGGLGRLLTEQLSNFDYRGVLATLICYLALTFLVDLLSAVARRSLR